jgi:hypothetical protein
VRLKKQINDNFQHKLIDPTVKSLSKPNHDGPGGN